MLSTICDKLTELLGAERMIISTEVFESNTMVRDLMATEDFSRSGVSGNQAARVAIVVIFSY